MIIRALDKYLFFRVLVTGYFYWKPSTCNFLQVLVRTITGDRYLLKTGTFFKSKHLKKTILKQVPVTCGFTSDK